MHERCFEWKKCVCDSDSRRHCYLWIIVGGVNSNLKWVAFNEVRFCDDQVNYRSDSWDLVFEFYLVILIKNIELYSSRIWGLRRTDPQYPDTQSQIPTSKNTLAPHSF